MAQQPRRIPGGGTQRTVTVAEFPISKGMAGSVLEIEPGALRELHWHPNADEWQYYLEGSAEMAVFLAEGTVVTDSFEAGDIGYVPMGAGHYIRNTGPGVLRVLIGFNNGRYEANDLSAWLAANPADVLATTFGLSRAAAETLRARQSPLIYRVHEEPSPEKLDALRQTAQAAGLVLAKGQVLTTRHLNQLLAQAAGTDYATLCLQLLAGAALDYAPAEELRA